MTNILEHKILTDSDPNILSSAVEAEAVLGWRPKGGVTLAIDNANVKFYSQALIKITTQI